METPHPVTVKGMAAAMLDTLGDPHPHQGTLAAMNSRLVNFIRDCEVGLVILDDFHHLIDKQTNRVLRDVSEWLKVQIKLTGIPYLVVGIEGEVERILKANSQLSRLFIREKLQPFAWDATRPETIEDYAALIAYVEHSLQLKLSEELERPELLFRLHYATDGMMNNLMNLLIQARRIHRQQYPGGTSVSLTTLAKVYEMRVKAHIGRSNPFLVTGKFTPSPASLPEKVMAATHRSAGQVLKTR